MIETIAGGLKNKIDEVVFVGGSVIEYYVDDTALEKPRVTYDVDVVIEIATSTSYDKFEEELRKLGFINDIEGPRCRMIYENVKLDVISTSQGGSGFTNKWYEDGFKNSIRVKAGSYEIRIFPVEYFIASKLEAFNDRGKGDLIASHDMEDIIYIFDGRKNIKEDIINSQYAVREYLKSEIQKLVRNPHIREAVNGHLGFSSYEKRIDRIINIFEDISG